MKVWRLRPLLLAALITTSASADELDSRLAQGDVRIARRLASVALKADKGKQQATARRLFERVMELDPENTIARGKLGFKKVSGSWSRSSADAGRLYWRIAE